MYKLHFFVHDTLTFGICIETLLGCLQAFALQPRLDYLVARRGIAMECQAVRSLWLNICEEITRMHIREGLRSGSGDRCERRVAGREAVTATERHVIRYSNIQRFVYITNVKGRTYNP